MNAITKKLLSFVIVLAMVLSMTPVITLPAAAATTNPLETWNTVDYSGKFVNATTDVTTDGCPFCGVTGTVTWNPIGEGSTSATTLTLSSGQHVYFKDDTTFKTMSSASASDTGMCVYFNNKNISIATNISIIRNGYCYIGEGLNSEGNVGTATVTRTSTGSLFSNASTRSKAEVYGGNYNASTIYKPNSAYKPNAVGKIPLTIHAGTFTGNITLLGSNGDSYTHCAINGGTINGNVEVQSGATLALGGTINGDVTIQSGAALTLSGAPTITNGSLTLADGIYADATGLTGGNIAVSAEIGDIVATGGDATKAGYFKVYTNGAEDPALEVAVDESNQLVVQGKAVAGQPDWWDNNGDTQANITNWEERFKDAFTGATVSDNAICPICGELNVTWNVAPNEITAGGHYYLNGTVPSSISADCCLYLPGDATASSQMNIAANVGLFGSGSLTAAAELADSLVKVTSGTLTMYTGTIGAAEAPATATVEKGGNIYVAADATFVMKGGAIRNGAATVSGGNIFAESTATLSISGGTISGGSSYGTEASTGGGNIYAAGANTTIEGNAQISGGKTNNSVGAANGGGNIYGSGTVTVSGEAKITGGNAYGSKDCGGNIYMAGGTLNISGGTISGGNANGTGGGNIWTTSQGMIVNISGGKITKGTAKNGGNIYLYRAEFTASGDAQITYGTATNNGGNIFHYNATNNRSTNKIDISDTVKVTYGDAENGGNIYTNCGLIMSSGTVGYGTGTEAVYVNGGQLSVSGGTLVSGEAQRYAVKLVGAAAFLSGGTIYGRYEDMGNGLVAQSSTVTLSGRAKVIAIGVNPYKDVLWINSDTNSKLQIADNWTGEAHAVIAYKVPAPTAEDPDATKTEYVDALGDSVPADKVVWGTLSGTTFTAAAAETAVPAAMTGKLYEHSRTNGAQILPVAGGGWQVAAGGVVNGETKTWYLNVQDAADAAQDGDTLYLTGEATLNGQTVTVDMGVSGDVTLSGSGTVSGIDTVNKANLNKQGATLTLAEGATINVNNIAQDGSDRYVSLKDPVDPKYTFHYFDLKLSAVSLRATKDENNGLYYKAQIKMDDELANALGSYGVALSLDHTPGAEFYNDTTVGFTEISGALTLNSNNTATVTSGGVIGIMRTDLGVAENANRGEMPIYANAYLWFDFDGEGDYDAGEFIMADTVNGDTTNGVNYSMKTVMKAIDGNETVYGNNAEKIEAFYDYWSEYGMNAWANDFTVIGKETEAA